MITGHGNIEKAVQAIKLGALDFITKPFDFYKLLLIIKRALGEEVPPDGVQPQMENGGGNRDNHTPEPGDIGILSDDIA